MRIKIITQKIATPAPNNPPTRLVSPPVGGIVGCAVMLDGREGVRVGVGLAIIVGMGVGLGVKVADGVAV